MLAFLLAQIGKIKSALSANSASITALENEVVAKTVTTTGAVSSKTWSNDVFDLPNVTVRCVFSVYSSGSAIFFWGMKRPEDQQIYIMENVSNDSVCAISGIFK